MKRPAFLQTLTTTTTTTTLAVVAALTMPSFTAYADDDRSEPAVTVLSFDLPTSSTISQHVRITNTSRFGSAVTVSIRNAAGQVLGTWQSPVIAPKAAPTFAATQILADSSLPATPGAYTFAIESTFDGFAQTLTTDTATGAVTNTSSCSRRYFDREDEFISGAVIASGSGLASELQLYNEKKKARAARLTVYNAATGQELGQVSTPGLAGKTSQTIPVESLIATAPFATSILSGVVLNLKLITDDMEAVHILRNGTVSADFSIGCEFNDDTTLANLDSGRGI